MLICPYQQYLNCYWPNFDQGVMVGRSTLLGWSLFNYNPFYCTWIWLSKFLQDFGSQILSWQHWSWPHLSISRISQLLLTQFWPNFNPISDGVSDQRLLPGGSLGPRSFFRLNLTSFWTCGTIVDQYFVKGVHQWSCRIFFCGYPKNWPK